MKKKKIILFSFTALMICLVAVLSCVFINSFNITESTNPVDSDLVVSVKNSEGIILKTNRKNSINPLAGDPIDSIEITATVNDHDTSYDELVWKLNFTCECCTEKLSLIDDKNTVYIIEMYDYFEHQVTLTVSSKINPYVSASCLINCNQRGIRFDGYFDLLNSDETSVASYGPAGGTIDLTSYGYFNDLCSTGYFNIDFISIITLGSVENDIANDCSFMLSEPMLGLVEQSFLDDFRFKDIENGITSFVGMCGKDGISSELWSLVDFWQAVTGLDNSLFIEPTLMSAAYYYFQNNYSAVALEELHLGTFTFEIITSSPGTGEDIAYKSISYDVWINLEELAPESINSITLSETKIVF